MKVLALLSDGYGAGGGIAQYNRDLMVALARSPRIAGVTALPRHGKASPQTPEKVTQLPPTSGRISWILRSAQQAVTQAYEIVFCGHLNTAPVAALLAQATGSSLWIQAHGIEAFPPRGRGIRAAFRQARLVTCVSRYTREQLLTWSDARPDRVKVLNNTFSLDMRSAPRADELFARLGLAGKRVFITVGRLAASERYKGQDRVISALRAVRRRHPDAAYLVVGEGDDMPRLQVMAQSHGVADAVVFAGRLEADVLPGVLRAADVFVMPSTGEGFGIAFVEAAAAGLPIIGGNRDGSRDALADGAIGALIDPLDQAQLADAMIAALDGRIPPRPEAVARFSPDNFARHVDELLEHAFVRRL